MLISILLLSYIPSPLFYFLRKIIKEDFLIPRGVTGLFFSFGQDFLMQLKSFFPRNFFYLFNFPSTSIPSIFLKGGNSFPLYHRVVIIYLISGC
jgi:hypothetical protein